ALHRHGGLRSGETVLIGGGGGNVGGALVAEAVRCGARVVATAREQDAARVRALGAVTTVDHTAPDAPRQLRSLLEGRAEVVVDELADAARGTVRLLQETPWRPRLTETVGLDAARSLHERLEAGGIRGRVVVRTRA